MRPGANHIDRRRALLPKDYVAGAFGEDPTAPIVMPDGGSRVSLEVARVQHQLLLAWRRAGRHPSIEELGDRWGFSKQTFSRVRQGTRWMGESCALALFDATIRARRQQ